jgi:molybdopterin biosynthesis enzyme
VTERSRFGRRYLKRRSLEEAREIFFGKVLTGRAGVPDVERVPAAEALGRVTAAPGLAKHPAPF